MVVSLEQCTVVFAFIVTEPTCFWGGIAPPPPPHKHKHKADTLARSITINAKTTDSYMGC
jgi:hypothetical protein